MALISVLALAVATAAAAHDTWIRAARSSVPPDSTVLLEMTSGHHFPTPEFPIDADRVARADVRLAGQKWPLKIGKRGKQSLAFSTLLAQEGIAAIAVVLRPRRLELESVKVTEYLEEVGAVETAGKIWSGLSEPRHWRETYKKHAKTFVRVGAGLTDFSWAEPVGLALEIMPDRDPTAIVSGDSFSLVVLKLGKPLPGFSVEADPGPRGAPIRARTDDSGRVRMVLNSAGPWIFNGTELRFQKDSQSWESDFTTLTIEVLSSPRFAPVENGKWPPPR